jgi:hypothetical protein
MDRLLDQTYDPNSRTNQEASAARERPKPGRREDHEEQERQRVEQEVEQLDPAQVLAQLTFTLARFYEMLLARLSA